MMAGVLIDVARIDAFWRWMQDALLPGVYRGGSVDHALVEELGRRVDALGSFDFELGPLGDGSFFALSPRGHRDRYAQTQAIVAAAPTVAGWTFLAAKPAKEWDPSRFQIVRSGEVVLLDLTAWEFVSPRFPDGARDVYLRPSRASLELGLSDDELVSIAISVVDGALGEGRRIERVAYIDVKPAWDDRQRPAARPLTTEGLRRLFG